MDFAGLTSHFVDFVMLIFLLPYVDLLSTAYENIHLVSIYCGGAVANDDDDDDKINRQSALQLPA